MFSVLLLDGDTTVISSLRDEIRWSHLGVSQVMEASTKEAALHLLSTEAIDIVISEIELSDGSGLELLHWIRMNHLPCELIFITSRQDFSAALQALHDHAAEYLLKPVEPKLLENRLRELVTPLLELQYSKSDRDIFPAFINCHKAASPAAGEVQSSALSRKARTLQQKVDRFIEFHYREAINRERIAESMFFSPVYLGKMYKQSTGMTISDRITECRIAHARRLLANPIIPIAEIADDVGFGSQAYFSTLFKKNVGMTPKEYRRYIADYPEKEKK